MHNVHSNGCPSMCTLSMQSTASIGQQVSVHNNIFSATLYILESFWYTSFIQHCTWCNCSYSKNILENIIVWLVVHLYSYDGSMSLFIGHDFTRGSFDSVQLSVYEYAQIGKSVANPDWTINWYHEQTQNWNKLINQRQRDRFFIDFSWRVCSCSYQVE